MDYWGAIANLLNRQATRTITGAATVERAVAVADSSSSGLPGTAAAAIHETVSRDYERSEGGGGAGSTREMAAISGDMGPGGGRSLADIARQKAWENYPY